MIGCSYSDVSRHVRKGTAPPDHAPYRLHGWEISRQLSSFGASGQMRQLQTIYNKTPKTDAIVPFPVSVEIILT